MTRGAWSERPRGPSTRPAIASLGEFFVGMRNPGLDFGSCARSGISRRHVPELTHA